MQFSSGFDSAGCHMLPSSKSFLPPMSNRLDLGVSRTNMTNFIVQPARFTPYLILASRNRFELWSLFCFLLSLKLECLKYRLYSVLTPLVSIPLSGYALEFSY